MQLKKPKPKVQPEFKVANDFLTDLNPNIFKDMDTNIILNHLEDKIKERETLISDRIKLKLQK